MKKIPTLFERVYANHKVVAITENVTPGCEWVLRGEGIATVKIDGSCCAVINGEFYKRYDAKKGKTPPAGAIPCCEADPVTGHHPHWVRVSREDPADRWFVRAYCARSSGQILGLDGGLIDHETRKAAHGGAEQADAAAAPEPGGLVCSQGHTGGDAHCSQAF